MKTNLHPILARTVGVSLLALLPAWTSTIRAAVLRADYRLQNTLNSVVAGAPPLANLGPNSFSLGTVDGVTRSVLHFARNDGVSLAPFNSIIPGPSYSLVLLFEFDDVSN